MKHVHGVVLAISMLAGCSSSSQRTDDRSTAPSAPNPQMGALLGVHASLTPTPIERLTPAEARRQPTLADAVAQLRQNRGEVSPSPQPPVAKVESAVIPGPSGVQIPVRVYSPGGDGPHPIIVYFHGGGWVIADLDTYDSSCRALVNQVAAVVISVDYRRAPEFKFPAAHEDCYAALQYVMTNAPQFGGDTRVAVAGESAGGNMAASVCLMAKERRGRMPLHQLLIYPITNAATGTESYREHANAKPLNAAMMKWFLNHYLPTPAAAQDVRISLLRASSAQLRELPPATVITADIDPLRSEGIDYAQKLQVAGVEVEHANYTGVTHEFFGLAGVVDQARAAQSFAAGRLRAAFGVADARPASNR